MGHAFRRMDTLMIIYECLLKILSDLRGVWLISLIIFKQIIIVPVVLLLILAIFLKISYAGTVLQLK